MPTPGAASGTNRRTIPEVVYADEIRALPLEPARETMVQGDARGGKGSR